MQELKVLFADDEAGIRMLMASVLAAIEIPGVEDVVIESTIVEDGDVAVQKAREQEYDILVTDVRMPNMNGMQAAQEIRQIQPDIYIIFATAYVEENMTEMTALGDHVVKKPYSYIHIQDGLASYFEKAKLLSVN